MSTKNKKELVIQLYNQGFTYKKIKKICKIKGGSITHYLKKANITLNRKGGRRKDKDNMNTKIIDLYKQGLSANKIHDKLGCPCSTVYMVLKNNNINRRKLQGFQKGNLGGKLIKNHPGKGKPAFNRKMDVEKLKELCKSTERYMIKEIAKILNVSTISVSKWISKLKIKRNIIGKEFKKEQRINDYEEIKQLESKQNRDQESKQRGYRNFYNLAQYISYYKSHGGITIDNRRIKKGPYIKKPKHLFVCNVCYQMWESNKIQPKKCHYCHINYWNTGIKPERKRGWKVLKKKPNKNPICPLKYRWKIDLDPYKEDIIEMYKTYPVKIVGKRFNVAGETIIRRLRYWGIEIRKNLNGNLNFYCKDGHIVRSLGERIIDDFLYRNKINHIYDKQLFQGKKYKCDFYLLDYYIYIEYWGIKNSKDYNEKRRFKENWYKKNNIKILAIEGIKDIKLKLKILKNIYMVKGQSILN